MRPSDAPVFDDPAGPYRAHDIQEGSNYELSNGHRIECMSSGDRHGKATYLGATVLGLDPAAIGKVGVDTGIEFNEGKNLRAPMGARSICALTGPAKFFRRPTNETTSSGKSASTTNTKSLTIGSSIPMMNPFSSTAGPPMGIPKF